MTSAVSICSLALVTLGDQPISDLNEATPRARTCQAVYATTRDAVLRAHTWNCATKRVTLAPEAAEPGFDFARQFVLPQDWLRTVQVGYRECLPRYRTEGRRILCNLDSLPLVYIWRNENEGSWDGELIEVMGLAIMARIAYAITKSTSERDSRVAEFEHRMKIAKAIDGQDDPADEVSEQSDLIDARMGYRVIR